MNITSIFCKQTEGNPLDKDKHWHTNMDNHLNAPTRKARKDISK